MSSRQIIFLAVLFLVLTKLLNIVHINNESGYWDLDRVVGLIVFLFVAHTQIEPIKAKSWAMMLVLLLVALLIDRLFLQLGFERIVQLLLLTALVEEILLRGILFEWLLTKLSPSVTLVSTSLFFTLVHPKAYTDVFYVVSLLFSGVALGGAYLYYRQQTKQKAIIVTSGLHMVIILIGVYVGLIQ